MTTLIGAELDDSLVGGSGADLLQGNAGNDTLVGMGGADTLEGGDGRDSLVGGGGNDTYRVELLSPFELSDTIVEEVGGGTDTIEIVSAPHFGGEGYVNLESTAIENAIFLEPTIYDPNAAFHTSYMAGNASGNLLAGNSYDDYLQGYDGNDTLRGGGGSDGLYGGNGADLIEGGDGDDYLSGDGDGDTLNGGAGNDYYQVDPGDIILGETANGGIDWVTVSGQGWTLANYFENLTVIAGALASPVDAIGNALDNGIYASGNVGQIIGFAGNDQLNALGATGSVTLVGGTGNDLYMINGDDVVIEVAGEGIDSIESMFDGDVTLADVLENFSFQNVGGHLTGNAASNYLQDGNGSHSVVGLAGDDTLVGREGDDTLLGGGGNDVLASYYLYTSNVDGNDVLDGGAGDDIYWLDTNDVLAGETAGGGHDIAIIYGVNSGGSVTLHDQVEDIHISGWQPVIVGNALDNRIFVSAYAPSVSGLAGNDALYAWGMLTVNANITLAAGAGMATLAGGTGDDIYYVLDDTTVVENAGEGIDTLHWVTSNETDRTYTLADNVENIYLDYDPNLSVPPGAIDVTGNAADNLISANRELNYIEGLGGNDTLIGGRGADTMAGGTGDDRYIVESVADIVLENDGEGTDTVETTVTYKLPTGTENLVLAGNFGIDAFGNLDANSITGNGARNILDGGEGADTLSGGGANDTYYVDDTADVVVEATGGGGSDRIFSAVNWTLANNTELLVLTGFEEIDGRGNAVNNYVKGNAAANVLEGFAGDDTLVGGSGSDTLNGGNNNDLLKGGTGNDQIVGGTGNDTLTGETGADVFWFDKAASATTNLDRVTDFTIGADKFWLSQSAFAQAGAVGTLAAAAFVTGTNAGDASDRVIYDSATGALYYDADGTGATAKVQIAVLDNKAAITAADFVVV